MFQTDLLSIIRNFIIEFRAIVIYHINYVDCQLARSRSQHVELLTKIKL